MGENRHIRTFIRPHRRHSEESQRAGATGEEVYVIPKVSRAAYIRQLRKGDVAEIEWCFLWAEPKSTQCPRPVQDMLRAMRQIEEDRKAVIIEWGSGRRLRSDRKKDRYEMIERAISMHRSSGRPCNGGKGGRPARKIAPEQKKMMRAHWVSRENPNNQARVAAIKADLGFSPGATRLRQMFGSPLGNRAK